MAQLGRASALGAEGRTFKSCRPEILMRILFTSICLLLLCMDNTRAESFSNIKVTTKNQTSSGSSNVNALNIDGINGEIDQFLNDGTNRTEVNRLLNTLEVRIKRNKKIGKKSKKGTIKFLNDVQKTINNGNPSKEIDKGINSTVNGILEPGQDTLQIELMGTK